MGQGAGEVTDWTNLPDDERGDDPDAETADKMMELEQTREEMHETVEAIGDRLSPAAITQSAKETVREATVGKVEDMAQSASRVLDDAGMSALEARTGIVETIRQNPLPATMAGIGLAWLLTHRAPGYQTTRWQDSRRRQSWEGSGRDAVGRRVDAVGERASEVGDRVTGRVEEGVDAIGRRVDDVGERVGDVPDQVRYRVYDLSEQARSLIEDSPLAVGAVAVAVGTAIGAALPSTSTERRVLRPATNQAIETAEQKATEALDQAEQRMSEATSGQGASGTDRGGSTGGTRSSPAGSSNRSSRKTPASTSGPGGEGTS
jgi:hypothetical protein